VSDILRELEQEITSRYARPFAVRYCALRASANITGDNSSRRLEYSSCLSEMAKAR